jgi:Flp pilus assembly protein CpaB
MTCGFVVDRLAPPPEPTTAVVVASRALPAGTELTSADVRVVQVPGYAIPDSAHDALVDVVGHALAIAIPPGLAVVDPLLADGAPEGPPGTVVVPVRFADLGVRSLVHVGDRVDVLAASGTLEGRAGVGERLARGALVLRVVADAETGTAPTLLGSGDSGTSPVVLLAVTPDEATGLTGAVGWASLSPVFVQ